MTHIFEERHKEHRYSVGFDPATGRAADFSAICVLDADTSRIVATHQSKLLPHMALKEAFFLASYYNRAVIVPERNGLGQPLVDTLVDELNYPNVYIEESRNQVRHKRGTRYGFNTSTPTRLILLEDLAHMVHTNTIEIPCARTIRELQNLVFTDDKGKRVEADAGSNDDMAFAAALAIQGHAQLPPSLGHSYKAVSNGTSNF